MAKEKYNVAVVGALGVVGTEMIRTLERRNFPIGEFRPLDIPENAGKEVTYNGEPVKVQAAVKENFKDIDIAIFSAGATASQALAPQAVEMGAVVVDNSTAWRMDPECPLVVPEVNPDDLKWHKGIVPNPNCSTIQMVVALKPLHDAGKIKRVVVSTYQAASGAGMKGLQGLTDEAEEYLKTGKRVAPRVHAVQLAFNAVPHIDVFQEHGYTKEEYKMIGETQKIFGDDSIKISPTAVRIPVWYGHSESINIETEKKITADQARDILSKAPGILLKDDPANNVYPTPLDSNEEDLTMVGRIREDLTIENGLNLWVVSNNIRKGAALNAVQIAETLIRMDLVRV
ncbi:MAG: aspartate-semialdehyde dehydrogenase [Spirochaeta sp.]|jgi:aspartate-semialdehyde dehydrogenase|nr:aspartate-semialdehyde dehydrogenase [Spirochaeta sp.]